MSEQKHTPEPMFQYEYHQLARYEDGRTPVLLTEEQYRRARACVNACEGLPTDLIERHGVTRSGIAKGVEELTNQRDTAWEEARLIRESIGANQEESTLDEVRSVVNAHDNLVSALRVAHRQRDELLAALELAVKDFEYVRSNLDGSLHCDATMAIMRMDDAIAYVKGDAA